MSETANKPAKRSFWQNLSAEWRKIQWPNKATLAKETGAVIVITIILGGVIALVDLVIKLGLDKIFAI